MLQNLLNLLLALLFVNRVLAQPAPAVTDAPVQNLEKRGDTYSSPVVIESVYETAWVYPIGNGKYTTSTTILTAYNVEYVQAKYTSTSTSKTTVKTTKTTTTSTSTSTPAKTTSTTAKTTSTTAKTTSTTDKNVAHGTYTSPTPIPTLVTTKYTYPIGLGKTSTLTEVFTSYVIKYVTATY